MRSALEAKDEIIEVLVVSSRPAHASFVASASEIDCDRALERIQVAKGASADWLNKSQIVQSVLTSAHPAVDATDLTAALGLTEGGTVWLSRRPRRPEVSLPHVRSASTVA